MSKKKYRMSVLDGDLYLSFDSSVETVLHRAKGLFPLTRPQIGLEAYAGPAIDALLDELGNALGIVIRLSGSAGGWAAPGSTKQGRRTAENLGFRLERTGTEAYLYFPNVKSGTHVHKMVILTDGEYFREGTYNPDVIIDLQADGSPQGIEILSRDKSDVTLRLCPKCNFPNSSLDERCQNCSQGLKQ